MKTTAAPSKAKLLAAFLAIYLIWGSTHLAIKFAISVVWAQQYVPSGIAALVVAIVPLWVVLIDWLRPGGRRPIIAGEPGRIDPPAFSWQAIVALAYLIVFGSIVAFSAYCWPRR